MRLAGLILAASIAATAHAQQHIENSRYGYTIDIPGGWHVAPDELLETMFEPASPPKGQFRFVGLYQRDSFDNGRREPSVIVHVIPYSLFGLSEPPLAGLRKYMFKRITEKNDYKAIEPFTPPEILNSLRNSLSEELPVVPIAYDETDGSYVYESESTSFGGATRYRLRAVYSEDAVLQAWYTANQDEWDDVADEADRVLRSFTPINPAPLEPAADGPPHRVENKHHGYAIEIPAGWNEAPEEFLNRLSQAASTPDHQSRYVGAYQQESFRNGLAYTYVLIQTVPFRDLGLKRPPTNEERSGLLDKMTGVNVQQLIDAFSWKQAREPINDGPLIEDVAYDSGTGGYTFDLHVGLTGIGPLNARILGLYDDEALLQAAYFAPELVWPEHEQEANAILQSFTAIKRSQKPGDESKVVLTGYMHAAFLGAIASVVVGIVITLIAGIGLRIFRSRFTPKPPTL